MSKSSLSSSESSSIRYDRLLKVFQKASDMAFNSVGEAELNDCFGNSKSQFGNALQRLFVNNMVVKAQNNASASFQDICIRHEMEEKLAELEKFDYSAYSSAPSTVPQSESSVNLSEPLSILPTILAIKSVEKQELLVAIGHLEGDLKRLTELAGRLRAQVNNELTAASEERHKIVTASNICNADDST